MHQDPVTDGDFVGKQGQADRAPDAGDLDRPDPEVIVDDLDEPPGNS